MNDKQKVLKEIFGHENFRSFQEQVIDSILKKQDILTKLQEKLPSIATKIITTSLQSLSAKK